ARTARAVRAHRASTGRAPGEHPERIRSAAFPYARASSREGHTPCDAPPPSRRARAREEDPAVEVHFDLSSRERALPVRADEHPRRTTTARRVAALALATTLAACGGDDVAPGGDGSIPDRDGGTPPAGEASLSFTPTWGAARSQFQGQNWQTFIDLAIFQPAREELRDTRLVVMLCATSDPTCEAPVLLREVAPDETDGDPIQNSFGPDVTVRGLPAGEYELMIFADTGLSRSRGYAWDDGFETDETAWGGVVSELDVMMSD